MAKTCRALAHLAATGWFNPSYLRHLVDAHQSGVRDYSSPLWTLLMFEAFLRNVDGAGHAERHRADAETAVA